MGKKKQKYDQQVEDRSQLINRGFRRMAFLLANLVCGIWLVLVLATAALDENRPDPWSIGLIVLVSTPLAYLIPYGLVRAIGMVVAAFKRDAPNSPMKSSK